MDKAYEKGLNYALYLLSLQMRTVSEIETKLKSKEIPQELCDKIIGFLLESKFLDDINYTECFIRSRQERYGAYRIRQDLFRKGVSEADIKEAYFNLEDTGELADLTETVDQILDKKIANTKIDWDRLKTDYKYKVSTYHKLSNFLTNRGFSSGVIKSAVSKRLTDQFIDEF